MRVKKKTSRLFTLITRVKIVDCSRLYRGAKQVRLVFYNPYFFTHSRESVLFWRRRRARQRWRWVLNSLVIVGLLVLLGYYLPAWLSATFHWGEGVVAEQSDRRSVSETVRNWHELSSESELIFQPNLVQNYQGSKVPPRYDLNLPAGRWIRSLNGTVNAAILSNTEPQNVGEIDKMMRQGAYLYTDYGELGRRGRTVILASHHFNMFVRDEDKPKTFQNLHQLQVGDILELIDDYKLWQYQIYKIEKSQVISETNADLIAYTCVYWWNSKLRLFVYAKFVDEVN